MVGSKVFICKLTCAKQTLHNYIVYDDLPVQLTKLEEIGWKVVVGECSIMYTTILSTKLLKAPH